MNEDDVRRIQGGRAMDAEDRQGSSGASALSLSRMREGRVLTDWEIKAIVTESIALARIMENTDLIAALGRAERERCAKLVENFPIRDGALLTRNAMAQAIRGLG